MKERVRLGVVVVAVAFALVDSAFAQDPYDIAVRGLDWLAAHQDEDGRWNADEFMAHDSDGEPCEGEGLGVYDVGVSALALLCFLRDGHDPEVSTFADTVKRGVAWLRRQQDPETGCLGSSAHARTTTEHAFATLALCEAQQMFGSAELKAACARAAAHLEQVRNPYAVWRYAPRDNDNDSFVTGCAALALFAALGARAGDSELVTGSWSTVGQWFNQMTDPMNGRCGYTKRGGFSARYSAEQLEAFDWERVETMTALALAVQDRLVLPVPDEMTAKSVALLAKQPPKVEHADVLYWWFGTEALANHRRAWKTWREALDELTNRQRSDGNFTGSWDPTGAWGEFGGRVYSTAVMTLAWLAVTTIEESPFDGHGLRPARSAWSRGQFGSAARHVEKLAADEETPSRSTTRARLHVRRALASGWARFQLCRAATHHDFGHAIAYAEASELARSYRGSEVGDSAAAFAKRYRTDPKLRLKLRAERGR